MRPIVPLPLLRSAAAVVLAASLVAGGRALYADLTRAFRDAGPSVFDSRVSRQIEAIRRRVPAGSSILLLSASATDGAWYTRLVQRALYRRNDVIVRYVPFSRRDADSLRARWSIHYGVLFATTPDALNFTRYEDLGALPAMPEKVWLGELAP